MHEKDIENLHCVYCGGKLLLIKRLKATNNRLLHAVLKCRCGEYPVLDGVLFLGRDSISNRALDLVKYNGRWIKRIKDVPLFLLRSRILAKELVICFGVINAFSLLGYKGFIYLFRLLGFYQDRWANYLLGRSADEELRAAVLSLRYVKRGFRVIDIGSGAGNFLRYLIKKTKQEYVWAVESSIVGIYLAKRYFAPHANYIYMDASKGLPFQQRYFDTTFMNDALHYIRKKEILCKDMDIVTKKRGRIILTNLHNKKLAGHFNESKHFPEYLERYLILFPKRRATVFSELELHRKKMEKVDGLSQKDLSLNAKKFTIIFS